MTTAHVTDGDVLNVSATGGCTAGAIWGGSDVAGVYLATYAASASNTSVPVAVEGVFTVSKKAHADAWAVGEKIYALSTGGVYKAVAAATGSAVPLGIAWASAATGGTTGTVKLCTF